MTALEWIKAWKSYLTLVKNRSDNTVKSYIIDVELLYRFATTGLHGTPRVKVPLVDDPAFEWAAFDEDKAVDYVRELKKTVKISSVQRKVYVARQFFKFLQRKKVATEDPFEDMVFHALDRKPPRTLTVDEMGRLLNCIRLECQALAGIPTESTFLTIRDRAMLETLYAAGLRVSELCNMNWQEIDFAARQIQVTGKGNKTRVVPLGQKAIDALLEYQRHYVHRWERKAEGVAPVFLSQNDRRIVTRMIIRVIQRWCEAAGVKRIHPHGFRHSCATHMLQGGADIRVVQALLGHSSLNTTAIYAAVTPRHLRTVHANTHPRA